MTHRELTEVERAQLKHIRLKTDEPNLGLFPDFLIVGPQRTGSTWLFHNLKFHPEVYLPYKKETFYFSTLGHPEHRRFQYPTLEDYLRLYETTWAYRLNRHYDAFRRCFSKHEILVRGEGTATYATLPEEVMVEIALLNPDMRVIVMARHPVQRAISHGRKDLNRKFKGTEVPEEAILDFVSMESQLRLGDYPGIVATWRKYLKDDHIMVGDYRLIQDDPVKLLSEVQRFLGIREGKRFTKRRLLRERINPTEKAPLSEAVREQIEAIYAPHTASFEGLWPA